MILELIELKNKVRTLAENLGLVNKLNIRA
jgi:hypothetical protein